MSERGERPDSFSVPLPVDDLETLRRRTSAKWRLHPEDVLPLPVAEMDFALAPVIQDVLYDAVRRSDVGYAMPGLDLGRALAGFAAARWDWSVDPELVHPATDVGVACVEMLRVLCRPGDAVVINTPVRAVLPLARRGRGDSRGGTAAPRARRRLAAGSGRSRGRLRAAPPGRVRAVSPAQPGRPGAQPGGAGRGGPTGAGARRHRRQRRDPRPADPAGLDVHAIPHRARSGRRRGQPALGEQGVEPGRPEVRRDRRRLTADGGRGRAATGGRPLADRPARQPGDDRRLHRGRRVAGRPARHPGPATQAVGRACVRPSPGRLLGATGGDLPGLARLPGHRVGRRPAPAVPRARPGRRRAGDGWVRLNFGTGAPILEEAVDRMAGALAR